MNQIILVAIIIFIIMQSDNLQTSDNCKDLHIIIPAYDIELPALQIPSEQMEGIAFRSEQDRAQFSPRYSEHTQMLKRFSKLNNLPTSTPPLRKSSKSRELLEKDLSVKHNISTASSIHLPHTTQSSLYDTSSPDLINQEDLNWFKKLSKDPNLHIIPALHNDTYDINYNAHYPKPSSPYGFPTKTNDQKSWASYFCCCFFFK